MIDVKTTTVDGKLVDITSINEYLRRQEMYDENPSMYSSTALEVESNGKHLILPFRGKLDDRPGIYMDGVMGKIRYPKEDEIEKYDASNLDIVNVGNSSNIEEFLNKNKQIRDMESVMLTDVDNAFIPPLRQDDTPEMRAFKEAIASKKCDIGKYSQRFGNNYLNDKRILKDKKISMDKLISISKNLDIELELTIRNANNGDVPNPMDHEITVILTGSEEDSNGGE